MISNQNPNLKHQPSKEQSKVARPKTKKKYTIWQSNMSLLIIWLVALMGLVILLEVIVKKSETSQTLLSQVFRKQTTVSKETLPSSDISEKYQEIINKLAELNQKQIADPELKTKIEKLSEEIYNLRALNPFYRFKEIKASFIPSGVPAIYGEELNISFDQVQDAINKVVPFGPTYGVEGKKITLTGADLKRYINIGSQTACEYCCGAKTLVREDGEAACGCAHSIMMRGLAAYLIKNHPELSDEQILKELNTWKITYFPKQTLSAKLAEMAEAREPGIKELLEEFPDFLPQMVGGC